MSTSDANQEDAKNMALLFFMDHLMQKNGRRTIHDLSCQFGARGFTPEMRDAVGATQEGLSEFLTQYPSLFTLEGDIVSMKGYGDLAMGGSKASPMLQSLSRDRDYEKEAVEFFEEKLRRFGPELQIKSLLGTTFWVEKKNARFFFQFSFHFLNYKYLFKVIVVKRRLKFESFPVVM